MTAALDVDMKGKVAVVTGATGGIGKEVARGLARMGATVVIGARNTERGEATRAELAKETKSDSLWVGKVDVAEPASVRAFAAEVEKKHSAVHVLVNNAGAWFTDRKENGDGKELTFATNVLGPYLLTSLLEARLRAGAPSRIVNVVSSIAGNYDESDLDYRTRKFDGFKAYGQSKQALRMLTWEQATRLEGSGVVAIAAAPGFVKTDFNQNASGFMAVMIGLSAKLFAVSAAEGADTPLWAAVAPEAAKLSGKYVEGRKEKDGKFREPGPIATLVKKCEQMVAGGKPQATAAAAL